MLLALPLALQIGLGLGVGTDLGQTSQTAIPIRAGVEWTPSADLALGVSLLDVPGSSDDSGASFAAVSGLATIRWQPNWFFLEGGVGAGHLITFSSADQVENPPEHGRGGFAWLAGLGGKWNVADHVAVGVEGMLTAWNRVYQPAHTYGDENIPAYSDLSVVGAFVLVSVWLSP